MKKFERKTFLTRSLFALAVLNATLVVSQEGTGQNENNYDQVECNFKDGFCGWKNLNTSFPWEIIRTCTKRGWWRGGCKTEVHYLQLQMADLPLNGSSALSSPPLMARPNRTCQLSFKYYKNCHNNSCKLSVEQQTNTSVAELWDVTMYSGNGGTASIHVPCSDESYKILIVGRKLASTGVHHIDVDDIKFTARTLPTTTEGITSLSRRVSLTSQFTLPATTLHQVSTSEELSTEPMVQSEQQTGDDGLSTGSVAAIVVVAVLVIIVIVIIVLIVVRRRNAAEERKRTSGPGGPTSPVRARVHYGGHDNLVYSATGYELDTMMERSRGIEGPNISPDYYNAGGRNSAESSAPTQDGLYENTGSRPQPQDEYATPDKSGRKKMQQGNQNPEDEYAVPDKGGMTRMKRANQAPQDEYALPNKEQQKKQKQAGQDQQQKTGNRNRKKGKKRDEAAAASTDYENVGDSSSGQNTSPSSSSHPEPPGDMYNELGAMGRDRVQPGEPPLNHYDRISATDDGYSGINLENNKRDQQREVAADQYSHI